MLDFYASILILLLVFINYLAMLKLEWYPEEEYEGRDILFKLLIIAVNVAFFDVVPKCDITIAGELLLVLFASYGILAYHFYAKKHLWGKYDALQYE